VPALADVAAAVARIAQPGDVVIMLGAGSIGSIAEPLIELLSRPDRRAASAESRR